MLLYLQKVISINSETSWKPLMKRLGSEPRSRIRKSVARIRRTVSVAKCHGSVTLYTIFQKQCILTSVFIPASTHPAFWRTGAIQSSFIFSCVPVSIVQLFIDICRSESIFLRKHLEQDHARWNILRAFFK